MEKTKLELNSILLKNNSVFREGGYETIYAANSVYIFGQYEIKVEMIVAVNRGETP